jgi:hypothetical protein
MTMTQIVTAADAEGLAQHLISLGRSRVSVVITCPSGSAVPRFDPAAIDRACDGNADVYVMPTGWLSLHFSDQLPTATSVYGGAARVYPRGQSWLTEPFDAPLVFAYSDEEAKRQADVLVEKAWALHYQPSRPARRIPVTKQVEAEATVAALPRTTRLPGPPGAPERHALAPPATVSKAEGRERAIAGAETPMPGPVRLIQPAPALRPPAEHGPGAVALADALAESAYLRDQLQEVRDEAAEHELVSTELIHRAGETVDGYRKLLAAARTKNNTAELSEAVAVVAAVTEVADDLRGKLRAAEDELVRIRSIPAPPTESDVVDDLRTQLVAATADADQLREAERSLRQQTGVLVADYRKQLSNMRSKRAPAAAVAPLWEPELFDDDDSSVRHSVYLAWTKRVAAGEKAGRPLPSYKIGARFAESIDALDIGQRAKALKCVVDVLTDLARNITGRQVRPLRTGGGGDDAPLTRADGAACFRANSETNAASARRLHYWKLTDGRIELSRIVLHDDMTP